MRPRLRAKGLDVGHIAKDTGRILKPDIMEKCFIFLRISTVSLGT
jgi:hypothetical protein